MRQTKLSYEELMTLLHDSKGCSLPSCLIVNEIGELAKESDERAFKKLIDFLKSENRNFRFIACCWLMKCGNPAALEAIYELIKKEKDEQVLEMAMEAKNRLEIILGWTARN